MRTKGESLLKGHTEELGGGLNVRGCQQSELGLMRSLMGVRTEATFTFSGINWEAPFQGPFFKVVEGLLDSVGSFSVGQEMRTRW